MVSQIRNMTDGKPIRLMIRFSLPLFLINVMQLLYTIIDSAVLGRLLGWEKFASVGAATAIHWMTLSSILGMVQGFGVLFAQRFGGNETAGLRRSFCTGIILSALLSLSIALIGTLACRPMLELLGTSENLIKGAADYLIVFFVGSPIIFAYNLISGMLRAMGDSNTPFRAMILATLLNIALDFALVFPFGIPGVSAATLLAQFAATVYCLIALKKTGYLSGDGFRWDIATCKELLRLGFPLSFRNAVIEAGGLIVQRYINAYDETFVAGVAVAKRLNNLLVIAGDAIEGAIATFVAQNFGAGKFDRIKRGVFEGLRMMLVTAAVAMAVVLPFGRRMMSLLIDGAPSSVEAILNAGSIQLTVYAIGLPALCLLFLYRSALQGIGSTLVPMLSGFLELMLRIVSVLLLTPIFGRWGVFVSDASGWVAAALLLIISYYVVFKRASGLSGYWR